MSSIALSGFVFACVFGSSLLAMLVRRMLPEHHLSSESKDVVKLGMGLIATLSALVLGLLISTAKGTYDSQGSVVNELSSSYILLDRVLARYGPEAKEGREFLKINVAAAIERMWPKDGQSVDLAPSADPKTSMETLYDQIAQFTPKTESQRELRGRALGIVADIGQARLRLYSRQDSSLPTPFLVVLVFWLTILFAGYGLLSPGNGTVVLVLLVCTLSVAGAIFLMLELSTPFAGVMRLSGDPLRHALSLLGQ